MKAMKVLTRVLVLVMLIAALTGCAPSSAGNDADKTFKIAGIYKSADQPWFLSEGEATEARLQELSDGKVDWMYLDAKTDGNVMLQMIDTVIAEGVDGVICCPSDQTLSSVVVEKLTAAGIPVVAADDELMDADGNLLAPWRGISGYKIGATAAEWAVGWIKENNLLDDPECAILVLTSYVYSSCIPRTDGMFDTFAEMMPEFENVFDADCINDTAYDTAYGVFVANPQIKKWVVLGAGDETGVYSARALEQVGLDKGSVTICLGGMLAPAEFEKGSCVGAAAYFSATGVSNLAAEAIWALIHGETIEERDSVGAVMATPENYKDILQEYL